MRQLLAHAEKFDLVVGKMEKLRKKIELAVLLQEKLAIMREPFSPSIVFPKIGCVFCLEIPVSGRTGRHLQPCMVLLHLL